MKILFVHNNYADNNSGEEHASASLAQLLENNGHQVKWYRRSSDELNGSALKQAGAFFSGIWNPNAEKDIDKLLCAYKPQLVQIQNLYPLISPAIIRVVKKHGIPIIMRCPNYRLFCPSGLHLNPKGVVCENCLSTGKELNCILKNCEQNIFKSTGYAIRNYTARTIWNIHKNIDAYIVQSDFQRKKFIDNGIQADKLHVLPGLTPTIKKSVQTTIGESVSYVGRISSEKGILEFIEAARKLPEIPFKIAGEINSFASALKNTAPRNIKWTGFLNRNALDDLYQNSRIIVVPGKWYEGFPNVITRAMLHGKPVITSNFGAMASIIDHEKNGLLVAPGDCDQLSSSIEKLYYNTSLCLTYGKNGQQKALKNYSSEETYKKLENIYQFATQNNKHYKHN